MPPKRYVVELRLAERRFLEALVRSGRRSARSITRARILLLADQGRHGPGWEDWRIAEALGCGHRTAERVRERFVDLGLEASLTHKPQDHPSRGRKLDGPAVERLIDLIRSPAPDGRKSWTPRLLAEKLAELGLVDTVSSETVRRVLRESVNGD